MVIYAESSAVDDPTVLKDEKFAAVRSQIFIFKEGELYFFIYNGSRMRKLKGMNSQRQYSLIVLEHNRFQIDYPALITPI